MAQLNVTIIHTERKNTLKTHLVTYREADMTQTLADMLCIGHFLPRPAIQ